MIYVDNRQEKIKIDEEFQNKLEELINFAL